MDNGEGERGVARLQRERTYKSKFSQCHVLWPTPTSRTSRRLRQLRSRGAPLAQIVCLGNLFSYMFPHSAPLTNVPYLTLATCLLFVIAAASITVAPLGSETGVVSSTRCTALDRSKQSKIRSSLG